LRVVVSQGAAVDRPSLLHVEVDTDAVVRVGGLVREVGRGLISVGA
jgi:predicted PhzF superfamily epimerase YddE/YHI9